MKQLRGESVLFILKKDGRYLCEHREWQGRLIHSIPGGRIDPEDRLNPDKDYRLQALARELDEELSISYTQIRLLGEILWNDDWLFHVYHIEQWRGELSSQILDTQRPIHWVTFDEIGKNTHMPGLRKLIKDKLESDL